MRSDLDTPTPPTDRSGGRGPAAARARLRGQTRCAGTGAADRQPGARTPGQDRGPRDLQFRRAVLGRLRHRGDAEDAVHRRRGCARVHPHRAPVGGDRRRAGDPGVQLSPDDQGLPLRGRRLHRHEGQLRADPRAGGRRRPVDGLRLDGRGVGLRRRGGGDRAGARDRPVPGRDGGGVHLPDRLREPARGPRVGQDLLGAHLRVHRLHHVLAGHRWHPSAHRLARGAAAGRHGDRCRPRLPRGGADVHRAARARLGQHRDDRGRGDLQRRARLQARRVEERPADPRRARALALDDVPRDLLPRGEAADPAGFHGHVDRGRGHRTGGLRVGAGRATRRSRSCRSPRR